jgi:2-C-methyl-D-erythritol 4-phosphate cytidylyltransferase
LKKTSVVIVAGGTGTRIGGTIPKQYLTIQDKTILQITIEHFSLSESVHHFVIVAHPDYHSDVSHILKSAEVSATIAVSGKERQDSVANGLEAALPLSDKILVHDAARPFVHSTIIENCIHELDEFDAVVTALKCRDTIKIVNDGLVSSTEDRSKYYLAQTPQGFTKAAAEKVMNGIRTSGLSGTDDVFFAERLGIPVKVVEGSSFNFKITTPEDLKMAEALVAKYGYQIA